MQTTTNLNLKKPEPGDYALVSDINDNMDTIDAELAAPTGDGRDQTVSFTDADLDSGITSFPTFLTKIVSGMKLAKFLRDFKAGMAYVLHVGSLVNNATCTETGKALDARMGKTLQDQITSLNDSLTQLTSYDSGTDYSGTFNNVIFDFIQYRSYTVCRATSSSAVSFEYTMWTNMFPIPTGMRHFSYLSIPTVSGTIIVLRLSGGYIQVFTANSTNGYMQGSGSVISNRP